MLKSELSHFLFVKRLSKQDIIFTFLNALYKVVEFEVVQMSIVCVQSEKYTWFLDLCIHFVFVLKGPLRCVSVAINITHYLLLLAIHFYLFRAICGSKLNATFLFELVFFFLEYKLYANAIQLRQWLGNVLLQIWARTWREKMCTILSV